MVLNTRLTTSTALTAGSAIPVGVVVHQSGGCVRASGNSITISNAGFYKVTESITIEPTAVADMTASLLANGTSIATATATPAVAGDAVNLSLVAVIYNKCGCNDYTLTNTINSAGSVTECDIVVERI